MTAGLLTFRMKSVVCLVVNIVHCIVRSYETHSNSRMNIFGHILVKDCNPANGPPCPETEHTEMSAPIYDTIQACCGRLDWIDIDVCTSFSEGRSRGYFTDPSSGSCLQECEPGASDCTSAVPPPIALYDSIDACCSEGQWWVEYKYCTSRSVGEYSGEWIVDFNQEKCGKSRDFMLYVPVY